MFKLKRAFALLLSCLCVSVYGQSVGHHIDIISPRVHSPLFITASDTFSVDILDAQQLPAVGWSAALKNDLRTWTVKVLSATKVKVFNDTKPGWRLKLKAPASISPELMDLVINHQKGGKNISIKSVSVVKNMENDFYIFHQSDEHIAGISAVEPGGKSHKKWGNGSMQALTWATTFYNIANPRFVIHTGDNMHLYNEANSWAGMEDAEKRVKMFFEGTRNYNVPLLITTGNHDIGFDGYMEVEPWREKYNSIVGERAFSRKMGSVYILVSEWTNDDYLDWARRDFSNSFKDGSIRFRLSAAHFYDGVDGETTVPQGNQYPDLMLVGHIHRTRVLQKDPYPVLAVATAQDHQKAAIYNFKRNATGWQATQPEQHADSLNVFRLVGDNGKPKLYESFTSQNNGAFTSNSVSITNEFPLNFYDGRVRFLLKNNKKNYKVKGGEVLYRYEYDKGRKLAILVKVDIKPAGKTTVSVSQ